MQGLQFREIHGLIGEFKGVGLISEMLVCGLGIVHAISLSLGGIAKQF